MYHEKFPNTSYTYKYHLIIYIVRTLMPVSWLLTIKQRMHECITTYFTILLEYIHRKIIILFLIPFGFFSVVFSVNY